MATSNPSNRRPTRRDAEDVPTGATTSSKGSSGTGSSGSSGSSTGKGSGATGTLPKSGAANGPTSKGSTSKGGSSSSSTKGAAAAGAATGAAAGAATSSGTSTSAGSGSSSSEPSFVDKVKLALRNASRNLDDARTAPGSAAAPSKASTNKGPTRRARLRLTRLDPWSVAKMAFLLSIALGIVTVVAVGLVWGVLDAAGVWDSINSMVFQVIGSDSGTDFDVENYLGTSRVVGFTLIVAGINVLLITAIATLAAFLYNLGAALLGGVEVTLAEDAR